MSADYYPLLVGDPTEVASKNLVVDPTDEIVLESAHLGLRLLVIAEILLEPRNLVGEARVQYVVVRDLKLL